MRRSDVKMLRVGEWVQVRSKEEILKTLDSNACLEGMPFMPEMFAFCGSKFQVYKSAHKTCDTVFPVRGRRVDRAVHLDTRCDGSSHGGCQASCLIFWKEAWLKPLTTNAESVPMTGTEVDPEGRENPTGTCGGITESAVIGATAHASEGSPPTYICQATLLPNASSPLEWWDPRQYICDYRSGNVSLRRMLSGGIYVLFFWLSSHVFGLRRLMRWFYDFISPLWGGSPFPRRFGSIPAGQPTPSRALNLQPGDLVRIRPYHEILETLDTTNRNRGLYFDAEEVPYCGKTYRVKSRVTKIVDEATGRMRDMRTPCIMLDSVICQSRYSKCRMFCPRSIYSFWREIWLERAEPPDAAKR
jgi:hypothetical protein